MTKFHPIGRRPLDGGNQDAAYAGLPISQYIEEANRERFVCVQIEDPEPLTDLDAIAALPGIDMILFGPGDFSQGIGAPGDLHHPEVARARRLVADACTRHGKIAATVAGPSDVPVYIEMGYRYLSVGADVVGLGRYFSEISAVFAR